MSTAKRAFTLIEMMIVVVVITVLATFLIIGVRHVTNSSKQASTKLLLNNLQGMLAELDSKTRLGASPPMWRWLGDAGTSISEPTAATLNFWRQPSDVTGGVSYRDTAPYQDAMDAPGDVRETNANTRNGARQILNTQLAMMMLLSVPSNRAAMEKISSNRYFVPAFVPNSGTVQTPGTDGVLNTNDDNGTTTETVYYPFNAQVIGQSGQKFRCINTIGLLASGTDPAVGASSWKNDDTPSSPILLDSWNNPILFVPATGLRVRMLNGQNSNNPTDNTQTFIAISPEGVVDRDASQQPRVVKPGRPFFASAGPDGNFATGDDNIYSFEP